MASKENSRTRLISPSGKATAKKYTESFDEETSPSTMIAMTRRSSKQRDETTTNEARRQKSNKHQPYDKNQVLADISSRLTKRKQLHNKW